MPPLTIHERINLRHVLSRYHGVRNYPAGILRVGRMSRKEIATLCYRLTGCPARDIASSPLHHLARHTHRHTQKA